MTGHDTGAPPPPLPFARRVAVDRLPAEGTTLTIEADEAERAGLAEIFDILAVGSIRATVTVKPWRRTGVKVTGVVDADVTQACVLTLEPVDEHVRETIEVTFLPAEEIVEPDPDEEIEIRVGEADPPEPFDGRSIDVGALVAEHVAVGLDPYPRAPGAVFEPHIEDDPEADVPPSPFAALAKLKGDDDA
ncbi:YceD family protein [Oharaeibacter diazotrophicus]|uniref:Uncharacterized metal-binding protein YceD (DUF177 family) n=1 Tax=Oharaeibacter diazotrophicus TaxID=1920512 RepID=A0A4R6RKQ6_9HYPH|nr:DUF177 domain-containing protein [Oharaeibacter diazotrophicus]TDP86527.1 uncharacterized metal-binding protein YceD (DUF177 family) [Oharaeibacter diazotrophicus]BBE71531.1 hypothetical protein OHA_1_01107 [Pleomorphomonas sp. SM30]GLS78292.1 metal-binding protein [Oharaeibacter diazotrophicus]